MALSATSTAMPASPSPEASEASEAPKGVRYRDTFGVLLALLADSVQFGTTALTLGADQFALPAQLLFSCVVSAVLMLMMGPRWQLLPAAALEFAPGLNVFPTFTAGTLWVLRKKQKEAKALAAKSEA